MAEEESDGDDREQRFRELIVHAVDLGGLYDHLLVVSGKNVAVARDDMPDALLNEMIHLTRLQFDAMCHDLTDSWLSHAAPTHLRSVLEGMAQIAFILGHETDYPIGTPRQRATCLALAREREAYAAMETADPSSVPPGNADLARLRVEWFEELHERVVCPYPKDPRDWPCRKPDGTPCDHRSVWPCNLRPAGPSKLTTPTLRRLTERMKFGFRALEQASSLVLHLSLIDRMLGDSGQGQNTFRHATYKERALTLAMGLSAYGESLGWVMETIDLAAASVLGKYVSDTYSRPDLAEIMSDGWDKDNDKADDSPASERPNQST